ncbi:hypothetical protein HNQ92_003166 [Rhabdobacter roseus]|uniref:Uncharacterized protein n=1 Tax=Rhabdobacter roseus TaxID=1655419 RepID=A0A840TXU6_9BACT|nr:hypothetical protein [Rhabdobacter roseus]
MNVLHKFCNFFHSFLREYGKLVRLLIAKLQKSVRFVWKIVGYKLSFMINNY